jgi:hypothetical protein
MKRIDLEAMSITRSTVSSEELATPMTAKKTVSRSHVSPSHKSNDSTQEVPMTTKKTASHSHVSPSHESTVSSQEVPMTTKKTASHAHASHAATSDASTPAEVAPHVTTPAVSAAATPTSAVLVAPTSSPTASTPAALAAPPEDALIPSVPSDYVADSGATYRGVTPKKTELLVLAAAVKNLAQFASYTQAMGPYAPPYAATLALFTVVNEWSAMRTASSAWDAYCVDQEGLGWATLRPVMERLRPLFDIAVSADPTLLVKLPSLATLLGARTAIAQKGAATRKRNRVAKAKGAPQTHGKVGKTRKRAEEKAALETLQEQQPSSGAAAGATGQGSVTTAPVAVVATPAATGASPVVSATSAVPAVTNGVNGVANGAAH